MIYIIYLCPISFFPWIHFPPGFILPPYHFAPHFFAPWKLFNDLHYLPMSHIIFPLESFCPHSILPPYYFAPWKLFNNLHYLPMSHIISPLDLFCPPPPPPLDSFCPHIILPPGNRLMIYTIYPYHISFFPLEFCPSVILTPPPPILFCLHRNCLMICTIYPCPTSFFPPWNHFAPYHFALGEKLFNDLYYLPMPHIILPPELDPWGWALIF